MRKQIFLGFLVFHLFSFLAIPARAQIGTWRNYLAYYDIQQIQAAGDDIFVLASNSLYQYNKNDQSITTYDKISGMSDIGISHIKWCQAAKRLVAIYDNSNIDLIETDGSITNVSDIYLKPVVGGKTIHGLAVKDHFAYLAIDFGVVKLNVRKAEISESYVLGVAVDNLVIEESNIYAHCTTGEVLTADLSQNLIDPNNWTKTDTAPSFEEDMTDYNTYYPQVATLKPNGPMHNVFGFMTLVNNKLYTANGSTSNESHSYNVPIQVFDGSDWEIYETDFSEKIGGVLFRGTNSLAVDPTNDNHVFAGGISGMCEYLNGQLVNFYNNDNSPIEPYNGRSKNHQLVTGLKFDKNSDLWILNSQAPTASLIKFSDGVFTKYNHPEYMKLTDGGISNKSNTDLQGIIFDSNDQMWFTNDSWMLPALYHYDPLLDTVTAYESFINQDGTTVTIGGGVKCVTEDMSKNIWIGTNVGPLMLERSEIENGGSVFTQVKVPRNDGTNYADYLLSGIDVEQIAVDGAGRKWFATNGNGVFLISADNLTQLQHFTEENSPLLSDIVLSLAINKETGEVFFGTDKGLCSYISDATDPSEEMSIDNVWAYPNPVGPDYTGNITIQGLSLNADVKILSVNGALVAEGRSTGGTFTWDGRDRSGSRVASGVYIVATATSEGQKGTVCKIAIVR